MRDRPQILKAVALLLQRVIRGGSALDQYLRLPAPQTAVSPAVSEPACPSRSSAAPTFSFGDVGEILQTIRVNHLQRLKKCTVINHQEAESLGIPLASQPSADGHSPDSDIVP